MCLPALLFAYAASSPKRLLGQLELAVIRARVRSGMANASDNARMRQILQRTKNRKALVCKEKPAISMDCGISLFGDPYGNRTHITAVKGRCLNLLTNGPGSGNLTRTDDTPGMNRMLYQLSYAAILRGNAS